jgi:hypothetical protein
MAPPVLKHRVKEVEFLGRRVPVVLQAAGGPSPLLAVGAPCSAKNLGWRCMSRFCAAAARPQPLR